MWKRYDFTQNWLSCSGSKGNGKSQCFALCHVPEGQVEIKKNILKSDNGDQRARAD